MAIGHCFFILVITNCLMKGSRVCCFRNRLQSSVSCTTMRILSTACEHGLHIVLFHGLSLWQTYIPRQSNGRAQGYLLANQTSCQRKAVSNKWSDRTERRSHVHGFSNTTLYCSLQKQTLLYFVFVFFSGSLFGHRGR